MIFIQAAFYSLIALFGLIGSQRGWAKEMMVIFSTLVSLAVIATFENLLPITRTMIVDGSTTQYWFRTLVTIALVIFGYQTPKIARFAAAASRRDTIQETLLGLFMGLVNGFMIIGSLWFYMHHANYPFPNFMTAPDPTTTMGANALNLIRFLPPNLPIFQDPLIYVVVIFSFVFVLVVFL